MFTNLDSFGMEVPGFNFKGESKINTALGGVLTSAILICTLAYAVVKMNQLVAGDNPTIVEFFIPDYYSKLDRVRPGEKGFRIAYSVEGYLDEERKDDPRYTKWITRLVGRKNNEDYEKVLSHHECTEEDYSQFYPVASKAQSRLDGLKND